MKVLKFMEMLRRSVLARKFNVNPIAQSFPICIKCGGVPCDSANMEDAGSHSVEIRVKHHGEEDSCRVEFPFRIMDNTHQDKLDWGIQAAMRTFLAFEKSHNEKSG